MQSPEVAKAAMALFDWGVSHKNICYDYAFFTQEHGTGLNCCISSADPLPGATKAFPFSISPLDCPVVPEQSYGKSQ